MLPAIRHKSAALPPQENLIILTLVAAPDEPAQPEKSKAEPVAMAAKEPPLLTTVPVVTKPPKIPVVVESPRQPAELQPKPSSSSATAAVHGDDSSREPGLDTTTQQAQVGVKANPDYLKNPEPPYPLTARRRHQEGLILLTVKVTAQGHAATVVLKQSSGFPLLDDAALNAVRKWEFQPARIGSMAVESEIEVPVRFKLTD